MQNMNPNMVADLFVDSNYVDTFVTIFRKPSRRQWVHCCSHRIQKSLVSPFQCRSRPKNIWRMLYIINTQWMFTNPCKKQNQTIVWNISISIQLFCFQHIFVKSMRRETTQIWCTLTWGIMYHVCDHTCVCSIWTNQSTCKQYVFVFIIARCRHIYVSHNWMASTCDTYCICSESTWDVERVVVCWFGIDMIPKPVFQTNGKTTTHCIISNGVHQ